MSERQWQKLILAIGETAPIWSIAIFAIGIMIIELLKALNE